MVKCSGKKRQVAFKMKSGRGFITRAFKAQAKGCPSHALGKGGHLSAGQRAWRTKFVKAAHVCNKVTKKVGAKRAACVKRVLLYAK